MVTKIRRFDGICPDCKERPRMPGNSYCRGCRNAITREWMRKNRRKHSELTEAERRQTTCRAYANVLIRRGKLVKGPCQFCGSRQSRAHHADYSKPREVTWVCRPCRHLIT